MKRQGFYTSVFCWYGIAVACSADPNAILGTVLLPGAKGRTLAMPSRKI